MVQTKLILTGSDPSLGRAALLLLITTLIYKYGGHEPHCWFHSKQYLSALCALSAAIRIEPQLINTSLILSLVNFSDLGEKLLLRNKHPGHNLRQCSNYV